MNVVDFEVSVRRKSPLDFEVGVLQPGIVRHFHGGFVAAQGDTLAGGGLDGGRLARGLPQLSADDIGCAVLGEQRGSGEKREKEGPVSH